MRNEEGREWDRWGRWPFEKGENILMKPVVMMLAMVPGVMAVAEEKPAPIAPPAVSLTQEAGPRAQAVPAASAPSEATPKPTAPPPPKSPFVDGPYTEASLLALAPTPRRRASLEIPKGIVGLRSPEARSGSMELFGRSLPFALDSTTPGGGLTLLRLCWKGTGRMAEAQEVPLTGLTKEGNVFRCLFHASFRGPKGPTCLYGMVFWMVPTLSGRPAQVSMITYDVLSIRSAELDFSGTRHWVALADANGNGLFNDPGSRQGDGSVAGGDLVAVDLGFGDFANPERLEIQSPGGFFRVDGKLYQLVTDAAGETVKVILSDCPLGGMVQQAPPGWRVVSRLSSEKWTSQVDSSKGRELTAAGNWQLLSRRVQVLESGAWFVAVVPPVPPTETALEEPVAPPFALTVAAGKDTVLGCPADLRCQLIALPSELVERQYELQARFFTADGLLVVDMRDSQGMPPRIVVNIVDASGKHREKREFRWVLGVLQPLLWDASPIFKKGLVSLTVEAEAKPFEVKPEMLELTLEKFKDRKAGE